MATVMYKFYYFGIKACWQLCVTQIISKQIKFDVELADGLIMYQWLMMLFLNSGILNVFNILINYVFKF